MRYTGFLSYSSVVVVGNLLYLRFPKNLIEYKSHASSDLDPGLIDEYLYNPNQFNIKFDEGRTREYIWNAVTYEPPYRRK